jgi:hypothetical protein
MGVFWSSKGEYIVFGYLRKNYGKISERNMPENNLACISVP